MTKSKMVTRKRDGIVIDKYMNATDFTTLCLLLGSCRFDDVL